MHLVKSFPNSYASFFQLNLHQGQTIDQDGHIIAVGTGALLLHLIDNLHLVAADILLIPEIDILNMPVIKDKVVDIVIVQLSRPINQTFTGFIQIFIQKPHPLRICKDHLIKAFHLCTEIAQEGLRGSDVIQILIALLPQIPNQLFLQISLRLVVTRLY